MTRRPTRSGAALALATLVLCLGFAPAASRAAAKPSDPAAVKLADAVMRSLGGRERWDALPGLRWSFGSSVGDTVRSSRRHAWNKHTGWHRVEGKTRAGDAFVILHNLNTKQGKAWMNGVAIEGDSLQKLIARATSLWINDTYWMLMPYKLRDPGVTLESAGRDSSGRCDVLALSFEQVGETPGDHYWVDVDRKTHRVQGWRMVLQGDSPPPVAYTWEGWEEHDGLWFPTAHKRDRVNVFTNAIETVREFRPGEFDAP